MALLVLLNNFLHDFSAAGWLFAAVVLCSLLRKNETDDKQVYKILVDTIKTVLLLMRLSFVGIVVFGVIRTLTYKSYEWSPAAGQGQVTLLAVKHIFFTFVFLVGLNYYIKASKLTKKFNYEKE